MVPRGGENFPLRYATTSTQTLEVTLNTTLKRKAAEVLDGPALDLESALRVFLNRAEVTGLRLSPLPHHPACEFDFAVAYPIGLSCGWSVSFLSAAPGGPSQITEP